MNSNKEQLRDADYRHQDTIILLQLLLYGIWKLFSAYASRCLFVGPSGCTSRSSTGLLCAECDRWHCQHADLVDSVPVLTVVGRRCRQSGRPASEHVSDTRNALADESVPTAMLGRRGEGSPGCGRNPAAAGKYRASHITNFESLPSAKEESKLGKRTVARWMTQDRGCDWKKLNNILHNEKWFHNRDFVHDYVTLSHGNTNWGGDAGGLKWKNKAGRGMTKRWRDLLKRMFYLNLFVYLFCMFDGAWSTKCTEESKLEMRK